MFSVAACVLLIALTVAADGAPSISAAEIDEHGFLVHRVESPFQSGTTQIRVLLPDAQAARPKSRVIYVLPVEPKNEARYGDGLLEAKNAGLHNKHEAIFVAPTFSHLPWYADHPSDPLIRQESHFLNVVIPFVDKTYAVENAADARLLLGFSKSGWGAWSLLLRRPETFGRATAWDAPLMMDQIGDYGTANIFGTQANFEPYRVADLLRSKGQMSSDEIRLVLTGYGNFRDDHERAHALLNELKIRHEYRDGPKRKHGWHSGWMEEAVQLLVAPPEAPAR